MTGTLLTAMVAVPHVQLRLQLGGNVPEETPRQRPLAPTSFVLPTNAFPVMLALPVQLATLELLVTMPSDQILPVFPVQLITACLVEIA